MFALDDRDINDNVKAVVSFHGGLGEHIWNHRNNTSFDLPTDIATAGLNDVRPQVLVLSGGSDDMATDIMTLEDNLNNATVEWEITRYSQIKHSFTVWDNPDYNHWADERSWESMTQFLHKALGEITFASEPPAELMVEAVPYVDETDGKQLQGYLAKPDATKWQTPAPAVVIIPYVYFMGDSV